MPATLLFHDHAIAIRPDRNVSSLLADDRLDPYQWIVLNWPAAEGISFPWSELASSEA